MRELGWFIETLVKQFQVEVNQNQNQIGYKDNELLE